MSSSPDGCNYHHIENGSRSLTIVFSAFIRNKMEASAFTLMREYCNFPQHSDYLFVRDPKNHWYVSGVDGLGANASATVAALQILSAPYEQVRLVGASMGAYAALQYSNHLACSQVHAFQPQTFLRRGWPRFSEKIHGKLVVPDVLCIGRGACVTVYVGEHEPFDVYQALGLLNLGNVRVFVVLEAFHNVLIYLHRTGALLSVLEQTLDAKEPGGARENMLPIEEFADKRLGVGVGELYRDLDCVFRSMFEPSRSHMNLSIFGAKYSGWCGLCRIPLLAAIGANTSHEFSEQDELIRIAHRAPFIDDIYSPLASSLAETGRYGEAVRIAEAATRFNPANQDIYKKILHIAERKEVAGVEELIIESREAVGFEFPIHPDKA